MVEKTCCVTGHRDIPENRISYVEQELLREVQTAIDDGYTEKTLQFSGMTIELPKNIAAVFQRNG